MPENDVNRSPVWDYFISAGYIPGDNGSTSIKNFTTTEGEIDFLYDGVGLIDLSSEGIIELRGKDVLDFLHRITTNSIKDLPKEAIVNTIFTNEKGRIIDTASVMNFDDYQILFCSGVHKKMVLSWMNKYIIMDDVKTLDVPGKYILFQLFGPQADSFITLICGSIINNIQPGKFRVISTEGIHFFVAKFVDSKNNFNFWVLADIENGKSLINFMTERKGPFDFGFIGTEALNSYRIEQGIPSAPEELNDLYNPHEARLLEMVSFTKGCYIGQEVIARLDTYQKVQKYLTGFVFNQPVDNHESFIIYDEEGNEVGNITSSAYSYKCKEYIGLGYLRKAFTEEGTSLKVKNSGRELTAVVHSIPFRK